MILEIIPIEVREEIKCGDDLVQILLKSKQEILDNDVIVITQKIISKQEGQVVQLSRVNPSLLAIGIANEYGKDPRIVQLVLDQSKRIVRMNNGIIISQTIHDFICANAGVDESNVEEGYATLLPKDSHKSAECIRTSIREKVGKSVAVIISDTFGRAFRMGQTNVAIGFSGITAISDYVGKKDVFGRILRSTAIATVDEISSAAELVMKKSLCVPIVILRNYDFDNKIDSISLVRPREEDLFR